MSDDPYFNLGCELWVHVSLAAEMKKITVQAILRAVEAGHVRAYVPPRPEGDTRRPYKKQVWLPDVEALRGRGGPPKGTNTLAGKVRTEAQVEAAKENGKRGGRPKKVPSTSDSAPDPDRGEAS